MTDIDTLEPAEQKSKRLWRDSAEFLDYIGSYAAFVYKTHLILDLLDSSQSRMFSSPGRGGSARTFFSRQASI
ncbi:MAG: hypothetical protein LBQ79_06760 [Deltaproteobacteria bacterium]|nr:hypothetical protein [Deltaproteobacteria bacterium]